MIRVEFRCNRLRAALNSALLIPVGFAFYFFLQMGGPVPTVVGVAGLAITGCCFYSMARLIFRRGPLTILDEMGIRDRTMGYGLIPWTEVDNLYLTETRHSVVLSVYCDHPDAYLARLPILRRIIARLIAVVRDENVRINFTLLLRHGSAQGTCPTCGHDLQSTPSRCPECGTSVSRMMARQLQFKELPPMGRVTPVG